MRRDAVAARLRDREVKRQVGGDVRLLVGETGSISSIAAAIWARCSGWRRVRQRAPRVSPSRIRRTSNSSSSSASSTETSSPRTRRVGCGTPRPRSVPFPRASICPRDSSIRSASRTDERPTLYDSTSSRSAGTGSPGWRRPRGNQLEQAVGNQLVRLAARDRSMIRLSDKVRGDLNDGSHRCVKPRLCACKRRVPSV